MTGRFLWRYVDGKPNGGAIHLRATSGRYARECGAGRRDRKHERVCESINPRAREWHSPRLRRRRELGVRSRAPGLSRNASRMMTNADIPRAGQDCPDVAPQHFLRPGYAACARPARKCRNMQSPPLLPSTPRARLMRRVCRFWGLHPLRQHMAASAAPTPHPRN